MTINTINKKTFSAASAPWPTIPARSARATRPTTRGQVSITVTDFHV